MNSYERVMNTLQGRPVDRPPALAILGFYGATLTQTPIEEIYNDADLYIAAQQTVIDTFGIDMVLAPFELSILAEAFKGDEAFFSNQAPNMKRPPAANIDEALCLPLPDPYTTGRLPFILETTRKLAGIYKQTVPLFSVLPGPAILPALILGMEGWMNVLLFDEPAATRLLEQSGKFWVDWANAQFEAGTDVLVVTEGMAAATISTRELFEEKCLPHIRACFAEVNGPIIFHHTGGPINHIIDLLPSLPNLLAIAVSSQDDLFDAREKLGPGIPLLGNIDNLSFRAVSADEIRTQATACLKAGEKIGHFVLCNSGADLPIDTPPENIHAVVEASKQFATGTSAKTLWVACSVLGAEVKELHRRGEIGGELLMLNSMLHMDPMKLERTLTNVIEKENRPIILIYGDCCPSMRQLANRPNVSRVQSTNCCQLLLGKKRFKELMHAEAFILLPEWTPRWKEIIEQELGLHGEVAMALFKDTRQELVYLDTGVIPVPEKDLADCAAYTGLPVRIETPGLSHLQDALKTAENKLSKQEPST